LTKPLCKPYFSNVIIDSIVKALKERTSKSGNSAKAEHRIILSHALKKPKEIICNSMIANTKCKE